MIRGIGGGVRFQKARSLLLWGRNIPSTYERQRVRLTSTYDGTCGSDDDNMTELLDKNRAWSASTCAEDPTFFKRLSAQQHPKYLWVGCSDSRVPANQILGLPPGEVFVHRNVGNQAMHTDMNLMSCLEYAVKELKVRTIIVCGHYGCGAVRAALKLPTQQEALVNCWISDIRQCRNQHATELHALEHQEQVDRLCELNALRQVFHVCTSPVVSSAWSRGQHLSVYGLIYSLEDGLLRPLVGPITRDLEDDKRGFMEAKVPPAAASSNTGEVPLASAAPHPGAVGSSSNNLLNNLKLKDELERHQWWAHVAGDRKPQQVVEGQPCSWC